jgi:hypothetical protein
MRVSTEGAILLKGDAEDEKVRTEGSTELLRGPPLFVDDHDVGLEQLYIVAARHEEPTIVEKRARDDVLKVL